MSTPQHRDRNVIPTNDPCARDRNAPVCRGCNSIIDPWTCQCGGDYDSHYYENHGFSVAGCVCYLRVVLCDSRDRGPCGTTLA